MGLRDAVMIRKEYEQIQQLGLGWRHDRLLMHGLAGLQTAAEVGLCGIREGVHHNVGSYLIA